MKKYDEGILSDLIILDIDKIESFCNNYCQEIKNLIKQKQKRDLLVNIEEIKKLKFYHKIESYYAKSDIKS